MPKHTIDGGGDEPSVTTWTRLEPQPRAEADKDDVTLNRSLQAQIRDPLWFLARQYQMGEFLGVDGGSPLHASIMVEFRNVTTYRPGDDDSKTIPIIDPALPVEVHVEREPVCLRIRGAVQLGRYLEALVRQTFPTTFQNWIAKFRTDFPIDPTPPDPLYSPPDAIRFRSLVATRVTDGEAVYRSVAEIVCDQRQPKALPSWTNTREIQDLLTTFVAYRRSLFSEPAQDPAWQSTKLDYDFALGSPSGNQNLLLTADHFRGGHLDWYSFSVANAPLNDVARRRPAAFSSPVFDLLPDHVVFRGMPDRRWWNFEDSATDFGQLDADHVDLPKLLVMEFALVFGNDWFSVPIPVPVGMPGDPSLSQGTLSRVTCLIVTDSFGIRTLIGPAEQTPVNPGESPWSIFKLSGENTRSDFILMAPTLGLVQDGGALEEVLFLRDDMAAMAWAVQQQLQSDLDLPVDGFQTYLQSVEGKQDSTPSYVPGGPDIYYSVEKVPPYNWVPMVPVLSNQQALYLRRGAYLIPDPKDRTKNLWKARALVLEPSRALYVADHAVPRSGLKVNRYFRFTRSFYGTTFLWQARKSGLGRGPGWSGLRFDLVRDIAKGDGEP